MTNHVLVLTTVGSDEEAGRLAKAMVEQGLAACANVFSMVRSLYLWKGSLEDHVETLVLFKTRADGYAALEAGIREAHSYEVPEVLAIPIAEGSKAYLAWIDETVKKSG